MTLSGAGILVPTDLIRPGLSPEEDRGRDISHHPGEGTSTAPAQRMADQDEARALDNRIRELRSALTVHRRRSGTRFYSPTLEPSVQEAILWLSSSCAGYHQLIETMTANVLMAALAAVPTPLAVMVSMSWW